MGVAMLTAFSIAVAAFDPIVDRPTAGSWTNMVLSLGLMVAVPTLAAPIASDRISRAVLCACGALLGSLVFAMPEWSGAETRLVLALAIAVASALLLPPGMHRGGFSFWLAQSVALAGASALALASGFAKLALPVGAVSATCGWIALLALGARPHRAIHAGLAGSIAISGVAALAAATVFAFDTGTVPGSACVLAGLAPLGCWLGELPPFRDSRVASGLARVLGCAAITGLVLLMCVRPSGGASTDAYALADVPRLPSTIVNDASHR
jgi:hypothetical protein